MLGVATTCSQEGACQRSSAFLEIEGWIGHTPRFQLTFTEAGWFVLLIEYTHRDP